MTTGKVQILQKEFTLKYFDNSILSEIWVSFDPATKQRYLERLIETNSDDDSEVHLVCPISTRRLLNILQGREWIEYGFDVGFDAYDTDKNHERFIIKSFHCPYNYYKKITIPDIDLIQLIDYNVSEPYKITTRRQRHYLNHICYHYNEYFNPYASLRVDDNSPSVRSIIFKEDEE